MGSNQKFAEASKSDGHSTERLDDPRDLIQVPVNEPMEAATASVVYLPHQPAALRRISWLVVSVAF